jgi:hypothetical protein
MNRYLAFLDILAYKDIIEVNNTDYISALLSDAIDLSVKMGIEVWSKLPSPLIKIKNDIQFSIISDSIIIWSKNDSQANLMLHLSTTRSIFLSFMLKGLPLRGGMTLGEFEILNKRIGKNNTSNIFFGKGLTDAFDLESTQNWSGCIISEKYFKNLNIENSFLTINHLIDSNLVTKYNVPLKKENNQEHYVLNWPYVEGNEIDNHLLDGKWIFSAFSAHGKNIIKEDARNKLFNTIEFFLEMRKRYLASP